MCWSQSWMMKFRLYTFWMEQICFKRNRLSVDFRERRVKNPLGKSAPDIQSEVLWRRKSRLVLIKCSNRFVTQSHNLICRLGKFERHHEVFRNQKGSNQFNYWNVLGQLLKVGISPKALIISLFHGISNVFSLGPRDIIIHEHIT